MILKYVNSKGNGECAKKNDGEEIIFERWREKIRISGKEEREK